MQDIFLTDLNKAHLLSLHRVLSAAGVNTTSLKAANPFLPEFDQTPRGRQIRMIVEASSPQLAAELKRQAGHVDGVPSLAMAAALADEIDPETFTGDLAAEYLAANPEAAQEAQLKAEQDLLAKLDASVEASQRRREGDKAFDDRKARQESAQVEAERRLAEGKALDARIRAKQEQIHNDLRVAAGNVIIPAE